MTSMWSKKKGPGVAEGIWKKSSGWSHSLGMYCIYIYIYYVDRYYVDRYIYIHILYYTILYIMIYYVYMYIYIYYCIYMWFYYQNHMMYIPFGCLNKLPRKPWNPLISVRWFTRAVRWFSIGSNLVTCPISLYATYVAQNPKHFQEVST